jgi:acetyltransferase-like isoleucine patch superfamily enzyme
VAHVARRVMRWFTRVTGMRIEVLQPDLRDRCAEVGTQVHFGRRVELQHPENIRIGSDVMINSDCHLAGDGGLTIGDHVLIGPKVMMFSFDHVFTDPERSYDSQGLALGAITIGSNVWIGGGAIILAGVTIGTGAVVGAGTVVNRDVEPYSLVVGAGQRVVRTFEAGSR